MKVFDIHTDYTHAQPHSVVARTLCEAEKAFLEKYPYTTIKKVTLHSEYVILAVEEDTDE